MKIQLPSSCWVWHNPTAQESWKPNVPTKNVLTVFQCFRALTSHQVAKGQNQRNEFTFCNLRLFYRENPETVGRTMPKVTLGSKPLSTIVLAAKVYSSRHTVEEAPGHAVQCLPGMHESSCHRWSIIDGKGKPITKVTDPLIKNQQCLSQKNCSKLQRNTLFRREIWYHR